MFIWFSFRKIWRLEFTLTLLSRRFSIILLMRPCLLLRWENIRYVRFYLLLNYLNYTYVDKQLVNFSKFSHKNLLFKLFGKYVLLHINYISILKGKKIYPLFPKTLNCVNAFVRILFKNPLRIFIYQYICTW